jgi:hypothetical protein
MRVHCHPSSCVVLPQKGKFVLRGKLPAPPDDARTGSLLILGDSRSIKCLCRLEWRAERGARAPAKNLCLLRLLIPRTETSRLNMARSPTTLLVQTQRLHQHRATHYRYACPSRLRSTSPSRSIAIVLERLFSRNTLPRHLPWLI